MLEMQKKDLESDMLSVFTSSEKNLITRYQLLQTHFMNSDKIANYFKNNEREKLYKLLEKDYFDIQLIDPNFFVMHFIDKNNITVLRMHKPESYNDDLTRKRPIVTYTNKIIKKQNGFEVGKNGMVYRITIPFVHNGEHIGVLEFGIKPKYFIDSLNEKYKVESLMLVKKEKLDILSEKKDYEELGEYAIVSKSKLPKKFIDKINLSQTSQVIFLDNKYYLVTNELNLHDYQGIVVSKIVIIKDITKFISSKNESLLIVNMLSLLVFLTIIIFIFIVFHKFNVEIQKNMKTITSLNKKSKYLHTKANTDELTEIYNKRYFDNYLESFIRYGNKGSIIFFDIDHFKNINDTYGHQIGDKVLKSIAKCIREHIRQNDTFARWGGEEFIIILNNLDLDMAVKKAEEFRKCIEEYIFEQNISATISLGVTKVEEKDTKNTLIHRVDSLLYKAKHNGRNCVEY
jgi:diguanylate cyclase (GGDEF)-like protein